MHLCLIYILTYDFVGTKSKFFSLPSNSYGGKKSSKSPQQPTPTRENIPSENLSASTSTVITL